jgi:hypothetical protein
MILDWRLRFVIVDCDWRFCRLAWQLAIGNWQLAIGNWQLAIGN